MHTFDYGISYHPGSAGMFMLGKLCSMQGDTDIRRIVATNEFNVTADYKFWPDRTESFPQEHQRILQCHHIPYEWLQTNDAKIKYHMHMELDYMCRALFFAKRFLNTQVTEFVLTWFTEQVRAKPSRKNRFYLGKEFPIVQKMLEDNFPDIFLYQGDWLPRLGDEFPMPPLIAWTYMCDCEDKEIDPTPENFVEYLNEVYKEYVLSVDRPGVVQDHIELPKKQLWELHEQGKIDKLKIFTYEDQIDFSNYELPYALREDFIQYHSNNCKLLYRFLDYIDPSMPVNKEYVDKLKASIK